MLWDVYVLLLTVVLTTEVNGGSVKQQFTGLRRDGFKLVLDYVDKQLESIDLLGCVSECVKMTDCVSASWSQQHRRCLLSTSQVAHDRNAEDRITADNDWTTKVMMKYTVFSAKTGSSINFNQAKDLCVTRQTTIASRADLIYSHSLGFSYYRCCWLSDGTIGYMVQSKSSIKVCSTSSNPWALCILN